MSDCEFGWSGRCKVHGSYPIRCAEGASQVFKEMLDMHKTLLDIYGNEELVRLRDFASYMSRVRDTDTFIPALIRGKAKAALGEP